LEMSFLGLKGRSCGKCGNGGVKDRKGVYNFRF